MKDINSEKAEPSCFVEVGGYLGLFFGTSLYQLADLLDYAVGRFKGGRGKWRTGT